MVIKYQVEGEKNMPYNISKIIVISSALTTEDKESETPEESYIWNEKIIQNNDVYIYLKKNNKNKEDVKINSVKIENIQILKKTNIGKIQIYMPNSNDGVLYNYVNDYLVSNSLTYTGGSIDNTKTLEINKNGGAICLSFANIDLLCTGESRKILNQITELNNHGIRWIMLANRAVTVANPICNTKVVLDKFCSGFYSILYIMLCPQRDFQAIFILDSDIF